MLDWSAVLIMFCRNVEIWRISHPSKLSCQVCSQLQFTDSKNLGLMFLGNNYIFCQILRNQFVELKRTKHILLCWALLCIFSSHFLNALQSNNDRYTVYFPLHKTHFLSMNITSIVYLHRNGITSMLQSTTKPFWNVERMYHESLHFQVIRGPVSQV